MKNQILFAFLVLLGVYGLKILLDTKPSNESAAPSSHQELGKLDDDSTSYIDKETLKKSTQIIIAYSNLQNSVAGKLYGMEFLNNHWQVTFDTIDCSFGKKGFANNGNKIEGDGKTPSGQFLIGSAFGYKNDLESEMDFMVLKDNHYWISHNDSELYNQMVDFEPADDVYAEKMKRKDHLYKYGIVIEYNTQPVKKGKGSAIFIHVERRKGAPTAGCVASSEQNIKDLIQWIKPQKKPIITMGNLAEIDLKEYKKLLYSMVLTCDLENK
jgi:L,D-peptidoglycan transpeptidase YkuD (ErfK/YbiS/YcfS/YnhG family)